MENMKEILAVGACVAIGAITVTTFYRIVKESKRLDSIIKTTKDTLDN